MAITSDWIITHNGISYPAGEVVAVLSVDEEQALIDSGRAKMVQVVVAAAGSLDDGNPDDPDELTPEQFALLPAAGQKETLEGLGIEPGSNAETRLQQYADWYAEVEGDDNA